MCSAHADKTPTAPTPDCQGTPTLAQAAYEIAKDLAALSARLVSATELLIDTETLGLPGMPFLLQIEDPETHVPLIVRVRDHTPKDILDFVRSLARPGLRLVGHNLAFDLAKLTHLATVAATLAKEGAGWGEEPVWNAERIWRPDEATFEERLAAIQVVWPGACVDTMLAAQRLPPFANELQQPPGITFKRMPVAAVPTLLKKLQGNLNAANGEIRTAWRLGDHVAWRWDDKPSSAEKHRRQHAIDNQDHRVLADVRFSIRYPGPYSLKTLAPLLGYSGPIQRQDFEAIFGTADETIPVWIERGGPTSKECGHKDAWDKSVELERDPQMLAYAAADIRMLRVVYDHYRAQPGFQSLAHDMALVPWAATTRMVGVHVDEQARDVAKAAYLVKKEEAVQHCAGLGLKNINSTDQVIAYVNNHVVKLANDALPEGGDEMEEVENSRRKDTLEPLLKELKAKQAELERAGRATEKTARAVLNLDMLVQARVFDRKLQFIESIKGDSVFPQFHICGTQTDRMTCERPNAQQMPSPDKETDWEKSEEIHFRSMFAPPAEWKMYAGDFDQLELRIKSGVTQDPFTQAIYDKETDADPADEHSECALKLFNAELHALLPNTTDAELLVLLKKKDRRVKHFRGKAKPIGFGNAYGQTEYGLAHNAGCSLAEAKKMLADYWNLCPTTRHAIDVVHQSVTAICAGDNGFGIVVKTPAATVVSNKVGVSRHFTIVLRMIYLAGKMADTTPGNDGLPYLERGFPGLAASPVLVKRGKDHATGTVMEVPVLKALRSALRGGAFALQQSVQRQSFNFVIQSLGAYLTKELQGRLYNALITPGVRIGAELPVLCGLQVHDEVHFFARDEETSNAANTLVQRFLADATKLVGCPIRFHFDGVRSWADKA